MEYKQLMEVEVSELTNEERAFSELHRQIIYYGNMTADSLLWLAKNLSEMKNSKLYREAGFESFDEYSEIALNLKRRHAYNYARIYEQLGEKFVQSNAQIGVSKLAILAGVSEEKREEIEGKIDIETVSVSELKKALKEKEDFKEENIVLRDDVAKLNQSLENFKSLEKTKVSEKSEELEKLKEQLEKAKAQRERIANELEKERAKKLESEVVERVVEIEKIVEVKDEESENRAKELQKEVETLQREIQRKAAEVESLQKKIATSDELMTKFKVKFIDLQTIGAELFNFIDQMDEEKKAKSKKAISAIIGAWGL